jgi:hypothetical protein
MHPSSHRRLAHTKASKVHRVSNCSGCWQYTTSGPQLCLHTIDIQPNQNVDRFCPVGVFDLHSGTLLERGGSKAHLEISEGIEKKDSTSVL